MAVLGHVLDEAFVLDAERVTQLRAAFLTGESRTACGLCRWRAVCDEIAGSGYAQTLLTGFQAA